MAEKHIPEVRHELRRLEQLHFTCGYCGFTWFCLSSQRLRSVLHCPDCCTRGQVVDMNYYHYRIPAPPVEEWDDEDDDDA